MHIPDTIYHRIVTNNFCDQQNSYLRHKYLAFSGEASATYMSQVVSLAVSSPPFLKTGSKLSSACGCLSSLAQVAQPVDQAQTLGPDEGGGEILSDLSYYDTQLLIRNITAKSPGLGSNLAVSQGLHQGVQVLAHLPPRPHHQPFQLAITLQSPDQRSGKFGARLDPMFTYYSEDCSASYY